MGLDGVANSNGAAVLDVGVLASRAVWEGLFLYAGEGFGCRFLKSVEDGGVPGDAPAPSGGLHGRGGV